MGAAVMRESCRTRKTLDQRSAEAQRTRGRVLRILEGAGQLTHLRVHPTFPLVIQGQRVGDYTPDFSYRQHGDLVIEAVHGARTADDRFRRHVFEACTGHVVTDIEAA